jgi:hypothetical protein
VRGYESQIKKDIVQSQKDLNETKRKSKDIGLDPKKERRCGVKRIRS